MIKFRYKRKETTNNGGSNTSTLTKNKSVESKSNDCKDDINSNALKCEIADIKSTQPQMIKTKTTNTEQDEYKENCIRAIVVSV